MSSRKNRKEDECCKNHDGSKESLKAYLHAIRSLFFDEIAWLKSHGFKEEIDEEHERISWTASGKGIYEGISIEHPDSDYDGWICNVGYDGLFGEATGYSMRNPKDAIENSLAKFDKSVARLRKRIYEKHLRK